MAKADELASLPDLCKTWLATWSEKTGVDVSGLPEILSEELLAQSRKRVTSDNPAHREIQSGNASQLQLSHESECWKHIKDGNGAALFTVLRGAPQCLTERGPLGETILHMLTLYGHEDLARTVASRWPALIPEQYLENQYKGETCVHIAIIVRNQDLARFFLDVSKAAGTLEQVLTASADGLFFQPETPCYFGETPLAFAVCSNQPEIVKMLAVEYHAKLDAEDAQGNNLMHMVVHHQLPDMYHDLVNIWNECEGYGGSSEPAKPLTMRKNSVGLTPLCLAASEGHRDIFDVMLRATTKVLWSFGPVTSVLLPLEGVDYVPGKESGAVEHIVHEGNVELLDLPLVQQLLERKWDAFAEHEFHRRFKFALLNAVLFILMVAVPPKNWVDCHGLVELTLWIGALACKAVVMFMIYSKLIVELQQLWSEGLGQYFAQVFSAFFENAVSMGAGVCFGTWQVFELVGLAYADLFLAISGMLVWLYLLWFLLGFRSTGHLVVMIVKIVAADVTKFAGISMIVVNAFAVTFFISTTIQSERSLSVFAQHFLQCFHVMTSGFEKDAHESGTLMFILVIYSIMVTVLLLNLLIAMMGDTYQKVSDEAEQQWQLERARIIHSIQSEFLATSNSSATFWIEMDGHRFLQVEEIDKEWNKRTEQKQSLEEVKQRMDEFEIETRNNTSKIEKKRRDSFVEVMQRLDKFESENRANVDKLTSLSAHVFQQSQEGTTYT